MNIKISIDEHHRLCKIPYKEYLIGSRLFNTNDESSDWDFIRVYKYNDVFKDKVLGLPNIHSFQVDLDNVQYIWMTEEQFWGGLMSGDGTMQSDIIIFSGKYRSKDYILNICRTYNIIKAYLGVARRDIKLHRNDIKKLFHANRSYYIAKELYNNRIPKKKDIIYIKNNLIKPGKLIEDIRKLRKNLNKLYEDNKIKRYYVKETNDSLLNKMLNANSIKEFKYNTK